MSSFRRHRPNRPAKQQPAAPAGLSAWPIGAGRVLLAAAALVVAAGCASLPDAEAVVDRHDDARPARFDNARGQLSAPQSAAVVAGLKSRSGDIDILDKQIALEQAVVGSPLVLGNKVVLLHDGPATYGAMFAAIAAARDHINLETYIFEDDEIGQQFADLLLAQRQRGLQVNLIHDSFGGIATPTAFFDRLREGGIDVVEFNPINPLAGGQPWLINHRDHRKLLIVDGRVAFIGGVNISSVYASGSGARRHRPVASDKVSWRDTHLQIDGPVVGELQKLFLETWRKQRGEPLVGADYFPTPVVAGQDIVRAIGSTPDDPYSRIYVTLMSAIGNAEHSIQLTNAYFVPDVQLLKALTDAAGRGVAVTLILPGESDSQIVLHAGRAHYAQLLRAGVRIHERRGALLHAKTALIDGVWSCVGSANLDWRSLVDNDEVVAVILGREFAAQMTAMIGRDLAASEAITLESWEHRSLLMRLKEWGASLLQRLL
ncbi:MAG: cardiolipin synthase B [Betaproteobacteria bacterium HGW-Betaproteobacteria-7]|jgi:cardiolipin synthase|nr:MAG: cardiolipin synthase B [Betaproteobacteria bacterium HGW-Betaproteobacteria-7]